MTQNKKKKKKSILKEIKKLNKAKISPFSPSKNSEDYPFLQELISQFPGGRDSFELAMNKFLDVYQSTIISCKDYLAYMREQPDHKRDYYWPLIAEFKANFDAFLADYSTQEQGTLVEAFIFSESAQVAHLDRESFYSHRPIKLTPSQVEDCRFYWLHYQIFSKYMIFPSSVTETIFKNIDATIFAPDVRQDF